MRRQVRERQRRVGGRRELALGSWWTLARMQRRWRLGEVWRTEETAVGWRGMCCESLYSRFAQVGRPCALRSDRVRWAAAAADEEAKGRPGVTGSTAGEGQQAAAWRR